MRARYFFIVGVLVAISAILFARDGPAELSALDQCLEENERAPSGYRANEACLRRTVAHLLGTYSTTDLMRYITDEGSPKPLILSCHTISHVIGAESYAKEGSLEQTFAACTERCRDGCIHGALSAAVAKEIGEDATLEDIAHASLPTIERIGAPYCEESSPLCHGIGHLLYMNSGRFGESLGACAKISEGTRSEACYQGVFMEAGGAESSIAFEEVDIPSSEKPTYPCDTVAREYRHACFLYLPAFHRIRYDFTTQSRSRFEESTCSSVSPEDQRDCFFGIGYARARRIADTDPETDICARFSRDDYEIWCTSGVVLKHIGNWDYNGALDYCAVIAPGKGKILASTLRSRASGSSQKKARPTCVRYARPYLPTQSVYGALMRM